MDNIKDVIHEVVGKMSSKKMESQGKIERLWRNVLEKQEWQHTRLTGIKEGQLSIHVDSPAWLYQMKVRKNKILERLKTEMPEIKGISFRIGKVK